ncbi:MAG: hypothetical protein WC756_15440 [Taibaiella sp.]|jgi:hypothetical protein
MLFEDEKSIIALFLGLQNSRTKSSLNQAGNINKQLVDGLNNWLKEINLDYEDDGVSARELWRSMFDVTPDFASILLQKQWFLVQPECDDFFKC